MASAPPTSDAQALPLADRTIGEVSDLLRARKLSSVELVGACLERIARDGERLNTFLAVGDEAALEAAREADRALAAGDERPLLGIPYALKDIFVTRALDDEGNPLADGLPTTAGSQILEGSRSPDGSGAQDRLRAAGAIPPRKTHRDELAIAA